MTEYFVPTAPSETEFIEKRSRFIGHVWRVETEEEARFYIAEMKSKYHDARHNCWCYLLHEGNVMRYSDDGEPQGTAGQPMLEVFRKEGMENVCCVVTRYFGGILLGAGGLLRAYTRSAKDALDAAGVSVVRRLVLLGLNCPYHLFERLKLQVETLNGMIDDVTYGVEVQLRLLFPEVMLERFIKEVAEFTSGNVSVDVLGERFQAVSR
jgi:uncharacterized YigZ family protein